MFHITILSVGRLKEKYLAQGTVEYIKRLNAYAKVNVIEVDDESLPDNQSPSLMLKAREKEGERLLGRLRPGTYLIALDVGGKMFSSEEMAARLDELALAGKGDITFAIGGTLGLPEDVLRKADLRLSFSKMTFPHQLMRLILLEQIYRWFKVARGEPYHK